MREIRPKPHLSAKVTLPGSKSYTQRSLVIAALAEGVSVLSGALLSEDTEVMIDALRLLGVKIITGSEGIAVEGTGGAFSSPSQDLYLGNNGTALRFLTTLSCLAADEVNLTGMARLQERPVGPLISALRKLGADIDCPVREGFPPLKIKSGKLRGGRVGFADLESSQYVSSLLLSAPYALEDIEIELSGHTVSRPYIDLTLNAMNDFGVGAEEEKWGYRVAAGQRYKGRAYQVEGDASSASYFFLAAALTCGRMEVANLSPDSLQGDVKFLDILKDMGCFVERKENGVTVHGKKPAQGDYLIDMGDIPDLVPTMAVLAAFRDGKTRITNC
ncbi:MAG: 3-phosphoshikimate 1-carboxyvinyltransferase, partial [Smithellaceae bacterium]|nr:3-phosphoshikimate 1-carboxyvinyltransferase [Smithellaceae bacterium]